MDLGQKLIRVRLSADETQESLATRTGVVSRPHLQKLESNVHSPTVATLEVLLSACGKTLAEFFESKIPLKYTTTRERDIHEALQELLSSSDVNIRNAAETVIQGLSGLQAAHEIANLPARKQRAGAHKSPAVAGNVGRAQS